MNGEWLFTCVSLGEAEAYSKEGLLEKCAEYFLPEEDGGGPGIQDGEAVQWYVFSAVDNASSTLASWGVGGDVGKSAQSQILISWDQQELKLPRLTFFSLSITSHASSWEKLEM